MGQTDRLVIRAIVAACVVLALGISAVPDAAAQIRPWEDNGYVSINFAYQAKDRSFSESLSESVYEETATYAAGHASTGGGAFDIGGGVRLPRAWGLWSNLAAGVAVTSFSTASALTVSGNVPNPLFFNRPRAAVTARTDLEYKEVGVHLHVVWVMPLSDTIIVKFGGGPSFFSIDQGLLSGVTLQETAPFDAGTVPITAVTTTASESAVGGNVGADVTYMFTEQLGGGLFVRWTGGSADLPAMGGPQSIDVGGFQSGGGIRLSF